MDWLALNRTLPVLEGILRCLRAQLETLDERHRQAAARHRGDVERQSLALDVVRRAVSSPWFLFLPWRRRKVIVAYFRAVAEAQHSLVTLHAVHWAMPLHRRLIHAVDVLIHVLDQARPELAAMQEDLARRIERITKPRMTLDLPASLLGDLGLEQAC